MAMVDVDGSCHFFLADSQSKSSNKWEWGYAPSGVQGQSPWSGGRGAESSL